MWVLKNHLAAQRELILMHQPVGQKKLRGLKESEADMPGMVKLKSCWQPLANTNKADIIPVLSY